METRMVFTIVIITLCALDLIFTFYYIYTYRQWQPNKPFNLMEKNPLLVFLWNTFGLFIGMFIGAVVILALNYIVATKAHWILVALLLGFLIFAMFNHAKNIQLLWKLIEAYPSGALPESIFGKVIGNNT